jgi:potassium-dependent mechanosensitive channel
MPMLDWLASNSRAARFAGLFILAMTAILVWIGWFGGLGMLQAAHAAGYIHIDIPAIENVALRLLAAAVIFGAIVYGTRILQTILRQGILTPGRIDQGIAYSIDRALGYAGLGFAILYAASVAGLDLTGLTILAGALSVGVGFGLQTVISNFVCGLIVLIERPIKVGDWVVVKEHEGIVRRISVRSTEIETFSNASVLIPNSEFITGTVLNWTHGDPGGKVDVKVKTSHQSDPRAVLTALQAAALRTPGILKTPAPGVSFDNFGAEALEFSVGVSLANIAAGGKVKTDLRVAILEEFRRAGIELALPQRQVQIRQGGEGGQANGIHMPGSLS